MGQKEIKLPTTPVGWAIHLSRVVKQVHDFHGLDRFPIKVADIARDYSKNVYPDNPITLVEGQRFTGQFEGALMRDPTGSGEWAILYNSGITSVGRINFTLGHELGHYLLHRAQVNDVRYCGRHDLWAWDSANGRMEAEANEFASYLLMPLDDFRAQTNGLRRPSVLDFDALRRRYDVSVTAAILKWLEHTSKRAMIVISRDGFIDWSWSSPPLLKTGVFFRARQSVVELPAASLAGMQDTSPEAATGKMLNEGVWWKGEAVFESVLYSEYHEMAISLLVFPDEVPWEPRSF